MAGLMAASAAMAQSPGRGKPIGTWIVEYDHISARMHSEPSRATYRGRLTLREAGDSLFGDLVTSQGKDSTRFLLRGTGNANAWTLYAEEPTPQGLAVLLIPIEAAMVWLREAVHGVQSPTIRFELVTRGDSITGTRTVTGFPSSRPRATPVTGLRRK